MEEKSLQQVAEESAAALKANPTLENNVEVRNALYPFKQDPAVEQIITQLQSDLSLRSVEKAIKSLEAIASPFPPAA